MPACRCLPCRQFTPLLVSVYTKLKATGKPFEVIFVSSGPSLERYVLPELHHCTSLMYSWRLQIAIKLLLTSTLGSTTPGLPCHGPVQQAAAALLAQTEWRASPPWSSWGLMAQW